jgi:hypothetical protein
MKNLQPVFENHISFVEDNSNTFATPHSASTVITDESMYESYVQTLLDGYDSAAVNACTAVLNHQRRAILENFIPHIGGDAPVGWHLRSFPFLVDVYSEPIVAEICNVYPTDVPGFTVPRSRFKAITRSFDGLTVDSSYVPTATKNIKPGLLESKVSPDTITNIYTQLSLDNQHHLMNRRYTLMTSVRVREEDPVGTLLGEYSVPCSIQPHSRYGLDGEFEFNDVGSETVKAFTSGNVNFDKGTIQFHVNFTGGTGGNVYKCLYSVFNLGFVAKGTPNGRTELKMENDAKDIFIDPNEDFMINMTEEELQDWSAIYKINPMRSLSEVIKRQILLNKDWELSYFLKANEENMRKQGAKQYVNLDEYAALGGAGNYTPARVQDVLAAITPRISTLYSVIRRNFNMYRAPMWLV